jgi:predicted metal-binding protein
MRQRRAVLGAEAARAAVQHSTCSGCPGRRAPMYWGTMDAKSLIDKAGAVTAGPSDPLLNRAVLRSGSTTCVVPTHGSGAGTAGPWRPTSPPSVNRSRNGDGCVPLYDRGTLGTLLRSLISGLCHPGTGFRQLQEYITLPARRRSQRARDRLPATVRAAASVRRGYGTARSRPRSSGVVTSTTNRPSCGGCPGTAAPRRPAAWC